MKGNESMDYLDEELLEAKRQLEREKYTTLETGIYAGEELITFTWKELPESAVHMPLPNQFVIMPESVKNVKYPFKDAPSFIITSLDSTVNISFKVLDILLKNGEIMELSSQFQNALRNINPVITIKNNMNTKTVQNNEMNWFDYKGFNLDGQSYNRVYLIRLRKTVLQGVFSCNIKDKNNWMKIIDKMFSAVEEYL